MRVIINRVDDWYINQFSDTDPYFLAKNLLEKLSSRRKRGLIYDRLRLIETVNSHKNIKILESFDKAIIILICKGLIQRVKVSDFRSDLFITDLGVDALKKIKERASEVTKIRS